MRYTIAFALLTVLIGARSGLAVESSSEASGLAETGANLLAAGKIEKAQTQFYKALAYDSHCAVALYELGKLFETEGNVVSAADFLAHASLELAKGEAANPDFAVKHKDAIKHLQKLNPYAMQYSQLMENYAQDLCKITKKSPDSLTTEEICNRIDSLSLATILPKDKLPNVDRPKKAQPANPNNPRSSFSREIVTSIPPDVERALKTSGWTTITGSWVKKGENIYEVTDGKLETPKLNGAVQVLIHKGSAATVKVYVCYKSKWEHSGQSISFGNNSWGEGYGVVINGDNCKIFAPTQWCMGGTSYEPGLFNEITLPAANPKNSALVTLQESNLDIFVNDKPVRRTKYKISKDGTFIIAVKGTATIESPKAAGG